MKKNMVNKNTNNSKKDSLGLLSTILLVVFVVLKLTGLIDWPWIWVLSPLWIGIVIFVVILAIAAIIIIISSRRK